MKRDLDLLRKMLLRIEELDPTYNGPVNSDQY